MSILMLILAAGLAAAAYFDLKYRRIPNLLLAFLLIVGIMGIVLFKKDVPVREIVKTGITAVLAYAVYVLSKKRLGAGDLKLLIVMSLYLSIDDFLNVCAVSFGIVLIYCVFLIVKRKADLNTRIPLAHFFLIGILTEMLRQKFFKKNSLQTLEDVLY